MPEVWYAEFMSKKMSKKKKLQNNRKPRKASPLKVFFGTFFAVVGAGLFGILLYCFIAGTDNVAEKVEEFEQAIQSGNDGGGAGLLWEAVPEKEQEGEPVSSEGGESVYGAVLADPEYMAENNIYAKPNKTEGVVTLGFAGDILFDDEYAMMANLLKRDVTIENAISEALLAQMRDVDIMMINNEFPYTDRGTPTEGKTYTFRADTSTVSYLDDMGVDIVSIANNHAYDFGEVGFLDTLDTLSGASIPYVGGGRNLEEAASPVYFISGDIKIAFVAATQIERLDNPDTKGAGENSPGVFRCWNPEKLYEAVAQAKQNSDFVIVFIHWGTENVVEPDWAQLEQAPKIAQAGADLIIGAHSHCLQGIQYYDDVPVIYSLGNFWFNSKTLDTCMVQVDISKDGIENFRFVPAIQSDCRTDLAYGADKDRIISYMQSISYGINIDSEGYVSKQ